MPDKYSPTLDFPIIKNKHNGEKVENRGKKISNRPKKNPSLNLQNYFNMFMSFKILYRQIFFFLCNFVVAVNLPFCVFKLYFNLTFCHVYSLH